MLKNMRLSALFITALSTLGVFGKCPPPRILDNHEIELVVKDLLTDGAIETAESIKITPNDGSKLFQFVSRLVLTQREQKLRSEMKRKEYRPIYADIVEYLREILETPTIVNLCKHMKAYAYPGFEDSQKCRDTIFKVWDESIPYSEVPYTTYEAIYFGRETNRGNYLGSLGWITLYEGERKGLLQMRLMKTVDLTQKIKLLTTRVTIQQKVFDSSTLLGTRPEFDIALATLCYFGSKKGECSFQFGDKVLQFKTVVECGKNGERFLTNVEYKA